MSFRFPGMKGFSLVELTVAGAIMAGGALLVAKQLAETSKGQRRSATMATIDQLSGEINNTLSNRYSCAQTLEGIEVGKDIPAIKVGEADPADRNKSVPVSGARKSPVLFEAGKEAKKTGIEISNMRLLTRGGQDLIQITFDPGFQAKLTGEKAVLKDFLVTGTKVDGKYVSCFAERTDVQIVIREQSCKAMGGEWINNRCNLKNLPRCIIAEGNSCLMMATYGYREVDKVRVGVSKTELKELTKCCREDVPKEPWPIGNPTQSCFESPTADECLECANPGPKSPSCPTCGPTDGLPFWEFSGNWGPCSPSGSQSAIYNCNPGSAGVGVSCAVACGPPPADTRGCTPPQCPVGTLGTPPNCEPPQCPASDPKCDKACAPGQTGTPPNCITPPPDECPPGTVGTPPDCKPPGKDCNVGGQKVAWNDCAGTYTSNYPDGAAVTVNHTENDEWTGVLKGQCQNGSITVTSTTCDPCKVCADNCPVPQSMSWADAGVSCSGQKNISTKTLSPGQTVIYRDNSTSKTGGAVGTCIKGDKIDWTKFCNQGCELSGDFSWGKCSSGPVGKTQITHGNGFIIRNTQPDYSGYKIANCQNGEIKFEGELCEESKKCEVPGGPVSWGNCSGVLAAGSYASGAYVRVDNTKSGFLGYQAGNCTNGNISWNSESCAESKPCVLSSPLSWGSGCSAPTASSYLSTQSIVLSNTKPGLAGSKVGMCENGVVNWSFESCSQATPCTLSGSLSWGNCSGDGNGTYPSGNSVIIANKKPNYSGNKVGSCENGTINWTSEDCNSAKPCNPNGQYSWGPAGECKASGGGIMKDGESRVISSNIKVGASTYVGSYVLSCKDGNITEQDAGCRCEN